MGLIFGRSLLLAGRRSGPALDQGGTAEGELGGLGAVAAVTIGGAAGVGLVAEAGFVAELGGGAAAGGINGRVSLLVVVTVHSTRQPPGWLSACSVYRDCRKTTKRACSTSSMPSRQKTSSRNWRRGSGELNFCFN